MDILLTIGFLLIAGFTVGMVFHRLGLPKIIGYTLAGVALSPNSIELFSKSIIQRTNPLLEVCLAFIAFEVGGSLKWSKIKEHGKQVLSITVMAGIAPFIMVSLGVYVSGIFLNSTVFDTHMQLWLFSLLLGAMSSPTAPAAILAVIHEYKARGEVSDTILGVVALDDVLGIVLFSLTIAVMSVFTSIEAGGQLFGSSLLYSLFEVGGAVAVGAGIGFAFIMIGRFLKLEGDGQWFVIIFSLIILCAGLASLFEVDKLMAYMVMGIVVVNKCSKHKLIFKILRRYTEELIFLFFFLLSGLHLNIRAIPQTALLILFFVVFRALGKFAGAAIGGRIVNASKNVKKYTGPSLLPQAGIAIGLVLSIYKQKGFLEISDLLLATVMGATIINELIGPLVTKYSLLKSGDIKE
ncbi:MAG: cation:proton antiporter [Candidatus Rifleibacteriota bacterium]